MDKNAIKKYAVWARNELITRVTQKAAQYEITENKTTPADADSVGGRILSDIEKKQRAALIEKIKADGFEQVMEEVAYTWFNRFTALRFMEVNNYLPSHTRVFTNEEGEFKPQILTDAIQLDLEGLNMDKVYELKEANKTEELYKYLLITQCNALSSVLPRMFQKISHYTELLLPDYLLREGSVIEKLVSGIPEDNFNVNTEDGQIEIIGWLYQYYISEKHEEVVDPLHGKVVKKEEVPAATQLFTTDWVVRYLIDNSVGRYWIERNPDSDLADKLTYFVKPKDGEIKTVDEKITPQEITVFDPCVGSGHFLIYAFDVLVKIYLEYGYSERDAAAEIVRNNLFGLDIDGRATQLAYFSVMMKARQYDRRFFTRGIQPNVYEIAESNNVDKVSIEHFCEGDSGLKEDVDNLIGVLKDAKEYGSILQIPTIDFEKINERFSQLENGNSIYNTYLLSDFQMLIRTAEIMSRKYAVVATNPPYLNKYDIGLKNYVNNNYKDYKGDLFSVFTYRCSNLAVNNGYFGLMTPNVWMFLSSYEKLREYIINRKEITTLVQMAKGAFFKEATVDICAFVICNHIGNCCGTYISLEKFKGDMDTQKDGMLRVLNGNEDGCTFIRLKSDFADIPGMTIAYWATSNVINTFAMGKSINEIASPRQGMATTNNNLFLRFWHEVNIDKIGFNYKALEDTNSGKHKWFPYNKGGAYRKWYGNQDYVVNWYLNGRDLKEYTKDAPGGRMNNMEYYFRPAVSWSKITSGGFSTRFIPQGFIFDVAGCSVFSDKYLKYILGYLNSNVAKAILATVSQTLNFEVEHIKKLPIVFKQVEQVEELVNECIEISKTDYDAQETSWGFERHPFIQNNVLLIEKAFELWQEVCEERINKMLEIEQNINVLFAQNYDLINEMDVLIDANDITLNRADLDFGIRSLISYAVGCMFGRYSLDIPGLAFAGGSWDASKYSKYQPDKDAIISICDDEYFEDDIVGRFVKFIEIVYGEENLEENLQFIANALGGKGTPREIIRNYFINDFYSDHVKTYQKRPIYWLFDSGKKNGFKCLVYMHRYQPDTIARIRTDYVHEQQSRYRTAIADLEQRINSASTSERVKLNKQLTKLQSQADELRVYEEKIHHLADQMISIDLDDGVKHNYEIFQDVLAKIK